jgi:hypothetical protein
MAAEPYQPVETAIQLAAPKVKPTARPLGNVLGGLVGARTIEGSRAG